MNEILLSSLTPSRREFRETFMIGIVNSFGSAVTAAFGVGNRIIHMAMVPAMGLSQANATAVGQNLGAGNVSRAEKSSHSALLLIGLILLPITLGMFFFGADISRAFVDDPEVIALGRIKVPNEYYNRVLFPSNVIRHGLYSVRQLNYNDVIISFRKDD